MRLVRDGNLFANDAVFEGTDGPIPFDTSHSYTGTIDGESVNYNQSIRTKNSPVIITSSAILVKLACFPWRIPETAVSGLPRK